MTCAAGLRRRGRSLPPRSWRTPVRAGWLGPPGPRLGRSIRPGWSAPGAIEASRRNGALPRARGSEAPGAAGRRVPRRRGPAPPGRAARALHSARSSSGPVAARSPSAPSRPMGEPAGRRRDRVLWTGGRHSLHRRAGVLGDRWPGTSGAAPGGSVGEGDRHRHQLPRDARDPRSDTTHLRTSERGHGRLLRASYIGTTPMQRVFSTPALAVVSGESPVLEVSVQGLTDGAHTLDVVVNGLRVGTIQSVFQDVGKARLTLPPGILVPRDNTVALVGRTAGNRARALPAPHLSPAVLVRRPAPVHGRGRDRAHSLGGRCVHARAGHHQRRRPLGGCRRALVRRPAADRGAGPAT